jgi:nitroreductase
MLDLDQAIRERHSTRLFLPQPVPRELVNEALALAQYAPSNSNIQPWHMVFGSGASRNRLVAALIDEAELLAHFLSASVRPPLLLAGAMRPLPGFPRLN